MIVRKTQTDVGKIPAMQTGAPAEDRGIAASLTTRRRTTSR
jgi:hypothetical protein